MSTTVDEASNRVRIRIPPILSTSATVEIRVEEDVEPPPPDWPAAATSLGHEVLASLGVFRWHTNEIARVTGLRSKLTAMVVAHDLGSRVYLIPVYASQHVVGDPALLYEVARRFPALGQAVRQGQAHALQSKSHHAQFFQAIELLLRLAGATEKRRLPKDIDNGAIVYPADVIREIDIVTLSRLTWLSGWFFPKAPIIGELEGGELFVIAAPGGLGAGRRFREQTLVLS